MEKKPDNGMLPSPRNHLWRTKAIECEVTPVFFRGSRQICQRMWMSKVDGTDEAKTQLTLRLDCLGTYDEFKVAVRAVLNTTSTTTNFVEFGAFMTGTEEEVRETGLCCKPAQ
jgi:hypothetical protein